MTSSHNLHAGKNLNFDFISLVLWSAVMSNFTLNVYCGTIFLTDCHSCFLLVCGLPWCQESFLMPYLIFFFLQVPATSKRWQINLSLLLATLKSVFIHYCLLYLCGFCLVLICGHSYRPNRLKLNKITNFFRLPQCMVQTIFWKEPLMCGINFCIGGLVLYGSFWTGLVK